MHLADGIITNPAVLAGLDLAGVGSVAVAVRRAARLDQRAVAWTGTLAAFLIAAQAVNVPLVPGTSAHVIGASLVTLAVGPARAIIAMTATLLVQALLFGDGGLTAIGINVLNLGVFPALAVTATSRVFGRSGRGLAVTAILGTALGSALGALALASALVMGAGAAPHVAFPWLLGVQSLAGLAEGLLTAIALRELARRAPHLIHRREPPRPPPESHQEPIGTALAWAAIALGLASALVPLASSAPDALERLVPRLAGHR